MSMSVWAVSLSFAAIIANSGDGEIVVTGERRAQAQESVPGNIAIIPGEEIASRNADHPAELLNRAPGVFIHRGSGQEHLTAIRSPVLTGGAGAGSFLYLENGVPLRSAGFANVNGLFEAQSPIATRIEVVRGPGGAFYGANAIHGAINVITPHPSENSQWASVAVSEYHRKLSGGVARENRGEGFSAGAFVHEDIGFRTESGADQQGATLRLTGNAGGWAYDTILTATNLNQETAGFATGTDVYKDRRARRFNPNPEAYRDSKAARVQSTLIKQTERGEFSLTPFARYTNMEFLQHFLPSKAVEQTRHWSIGAQSGYYLDNGLKVGLDTEFTRGYLEEVQSRPDIFSFVQGVHYDYDINATSLSPFISYDRSLADGLSLQLAARADWTRYDYETNTEANRIGRFIRPADRSDEFLTFSPKASLLKQFATGVGWVSYAEGARPPQTSDLYRLQLNQTVADIDPERIRSVEAGWRGKFTDRVEGEIAAFYAEKENFLFRDADGFTVSDGETRHTGVELSLNADLTDTVSLAFNGTYAQHTYQFDRPVNSAANATESISKGDDIDTAPRTLAGGRLNWKPTPDFRVQTEWVHVGKYFTDAANEHDYPGHDIFHVRVEKNHGFATLYAITRNVFDTRYATRADFAFGTERYFPDEGRTLTLGVRVQN